MDVRTDAKGVYAASRVLSSIRQKEVLSLQDVKDVCRAVINRYDQSKDSAELSTMAQHTLEVMGSSIWLSRIEIMALSLIKEEEREAEQIESKELEQLRASIQTCGDCGYKYLADSHEYPCPKCHNDKASVYLDAINKISDICTDKENHGAQLTGINPIQRIIVEAHGKVLDDGEET